MENPEKTTCESDTPPETKRVGCSHYKRRAKFVTPCCNKFYMCRYCHDENEQHYFNRKTVTELICTECDTRQKVQAECEKCGVRFGKYTCLVCNLFDDEDKRQYHCEGCGICRVGGRDRFFHCQVCNMCLPVQLLRDGHRCVENVSRSNCPVCLEDIHTSRIPCHIPDCGHLLHRTCFEELLHSGHYACPTCQTSMIDMTSTITAGVDTNDLFRVPNDKTDVLAKHSLTRGVVLLNELAKNLDLWKYLDSEVAMTPMPPEYSEYKATILCKDCHKVSTVKFHVVGLKCAHCGAYNTCQTKGFQKGMDPTQVGVNPTTDEAIAGNSTASSSSAGSSSSDTMADSEPAHSSGASTSSSSSRARPINGVGSSSVSDPLEGGSQLMQPSISDEPPQA